MRLNPEKIIDIRDYFKYPPFLALEHFSQDVLSLDEDVLLTPLKDLPCDPDISRFFKEYDFSTIEREWICELARDMYSRIERISGVSCGSPTLADDIYFHLRVNLGKLQ